MPISLINMRTGESHPIDPERTLVGSAAHADVRLPDESPFLAALVIERNDIRKRALELQAELARYARPPHTKAL